MAFLETDREVSMAQLKCLNCGKNLTPGDVFCPKCGTRAGQKKGPDEASNVTRSHVTLTLMKTTCEWIDDPGLKREFAQRGLRSRSAIVQAACDEYFGNHIYRGLDGKLHDRDIAGTNAYPEGIEDKSSVWSDRSYH
jgi:hypothetical protein